MKRCPKCNNLMPDDALRCIRCGNESPSTGGRQPNGSTNAHPVPGDDRRSSRRIQWTRVFAVVLTSKLFFLASCTGGMFLSHSVLDRLDSGAHMDQGRAPDTMMSVIAVIPNADRPRERTVVQVLLGEMERFKRSNPDYSFVPALGKGEVDNHSNMKTVYTVTSAGPGKVLVETRVSVDVPPGGLHVRARYEATEKEVKPLYTKRGPDGVVMMIFGLLLALVLALAGQIFKWRLPRAADLATATARPLFVRFGLSGLKSRSAALAWMWFCIAVAVAVTVVSVFSESDESWYGLIYLLPALLVAWWLRYAIKWVDENGVWK